MWSNRSNLSSLNDDLETMDKREFPTPSSCCIYRVLPRLRKMNEAAYTPVSVSIGPYHHGKEGLESMEEVKLWFLYKFFKRTQAKPVDHYVDRLKGQEGKIRRCYSETIPMESDKFVRMILTDACFIIEYFLQWHDKTYWPLMWDITTTDLFLLENQLPFFVLKDLFDLTFPDGYNDERLFEAFTFDYLNTSFGSQIVSNKELRDFTFQYFVQHNLAPQVHHLCDMLRMFFVRLDDQLPRESTDREMKPVSRVHHLCDMLRMFFVRPDDQLPGKSTDREMKPVYSVSKLYDAGIKFKVNEKEISLLKLKFSEGVLKIPKMIICDHTEAQLRNVVAFEQYHFPSSRSMTNYILLLGFLIRTEKDVEILAEKGIIQNIMGKNDAVASMTERLGWNTTYTNFDEGYIILFEALNKFCDSSYHKYKAIFKQQYWSTPWRIASFLGAILLLLLTLTQTITSVIALFQK
ncbi:hypothetical protein K1719_017784 [Acacia pycnantha]|nr:hypothetical protein K1719_017784 [Acacia pycnantha]